MKRCCSVGWLGQGVDESEPCRIGVERAEDRIEVFVKRRRKRAFCVRQSASGQIHVVEGEVRHDFIRVLPVVQQLCDSPVKGEGRRVFTMVDLDVQPLRVEVVRYAETVVVCLAHDGGGIFSLLNNVIVVQSDEAKV